MGYAGGRQPDPTYRRLGDHTETLQIDFDPARIDYEVLLKHFWESHNPTRPRPTQYKSVIFYHDEIQRRLAEASLARETARRQKVLHTDIRPLLSFYRAEDYHQKYYLRREKDLMRELEKYFSSGRELVDATSAARINGYLAGFGDRQALVTQGDRLGLSAGGLRRVLEVYAWRH